MKNLDIATAKVGDDVKLFSGWTHSIGQVVRIRESEYRRNIITVTARQIHGVDYLNYQLWEGAFPTFSQLVEGTEHSDELLQAAWDMTHPGQAPRDCLRCGQSFRPTWRGPGCAVYCPTCNPPRQQAGPGDCHYCGQPPTDTGFFGEPVCNECGG